MSDTDSSNDADFVQALTKWQRDLRRYILGIAPSKIDADDVLQEVNLALWSRRHLYDPSQKFLPWAFGFAAMEVRNFANRQSKDQLWFDDHVLSLVCDAYPQDAQLLEYRRDALSRCIQQLGTVEFRFITDFYREQCSAQALAEASGKPLSTVYKILARARRTLRGCIHRRMASYSRPV